MFNENEKKVFGYEIAGQKRYLDPLAVFRQFLRSSRGDWHRWRTEATTVEEVGAPAPPGAPPDVARMHQEGHRIAAVMNRIDAEERVLLLVREVFGLPAVDKTTGEGVAEEDCWRVLAEFDGWMEKND